LLERLVELGEVKAALSAKGCERRGGVNAGDQEHASAALAIGSFEDNWPWPRRPTFQAGVAASGAFRIRKCRANPDCEW
jgi:hypothetical protein